MNKFPTWRYFVIIAVLMLGILYALPNLYPAQPAIQVAYTDSSKSADQSLLNTIREEIAKQDIEISEINLKNNNIVAQFSSVEDQLVAKTALQKALLDVDHSLVRFLLRDRLEVLTTLGLMPWNLH